MLPTAELHVHLEGTLDPAGGALATAHDFRRATTSYFERAAAAGVRHAEVSVDAQTHGAHGVPLAAIVEGVGEARETAEGFGLSSGLILGLRRDLGPEAADEMLTLALAFREHFVAVGLDSAEPGHPPAPFREVFERAGAEGLHRVAHAGQRTGPDYVWEALDVLGAERIDHGNRALDDLDLVARLRDEQVPLTVCPLSDLRAGAGPSALADHPLPIMLDERLNVSIHSDRPTVTGAWIDDVTTAVRDALELPPAALETLAANAIRSSFAPDARKAALLAEVEEAARALR